MDNITTKRGLRIELRHVIKDCRPEVGIRLGRVVDIQEGKAIINWGPGQRYSRIKADHIHSNTKRRTGYALLRSWSPGRKRQ